MAQYVFTMNRVGKVVPPKRVILKDISLSFFPGAKIGVLGLNGSGKSSLLRIMAGVDSQFEGEARPMPNLKLGYLAQEPQLDESLDVRGNVEQGLGEAISLVKDFNAISDRFAEPMDDEEMNQLLERQGELQSAIDACNGWEIERRLEIAADALRLPPWQGNYSSWLEQKEARLQIEAKQESARIKAMQDELEWVRSNPKGRQAKSKARLQRFEELASTEAQARNETNEIYIPPGPRLGDLVVEASGLCKRFGDKILYDDLNFALPPGGIVGVIGPNGAGKTTLFRMITGEEKPDQGQLRIGDTVRVAAVDQSRDQLNGQKTVWEEISDGLDNITVGTYVTSSRGYCARFNFKGADQQKRIGDLSGGERNRVHLAKTLRLGGNLLLLDEPTNDLDVETLRALEQALLQFPGCAVVISHDRWFLDRIATHILAFEGNSQVVWFEGNYADYLADRRRRLGDAADQPERIRYKALSA
ncbi:MAG: ATP-binding cassette domain-containing protein [Betaproteobacteria bacterium]|nr:ATP-binding cassette domain-containing protein [Betaproteobacteria bacterium]